LVLQTRNRKHGLKTTRCPTGRRNRLHGPHTYALRWVISGDSSIKFNGSVGLLDSFNAELVPDRSGGDRRGGEGGIYIPNATLSPSD